MYKAPGHSWIELFFSRCHQCEDGVLGATSGPSFWNRRKFRAAVFGQGDCDLGGVCSVQDHGELLVL